MKSDRIKELKLCLRLANKAYDSICGDTNKANAAYLIIEVLEKRLKKLNK